MKEILITKLKLTENTRLTSTIDNAITALVRRIDRVRSFVA